MDQTLAKPKTLITPLNAQGGHATRLSLLLHLGSGVNFPLLSYQLSPCLSFRQILNTYLFINHYNYTTWPEIYRQLTITPMWYFSKLQTQNLKHTALKDVFVYSRNKMSLQWNLGVQTWSSMTLPQVHKVIVCQIRSGSPAQNSNTNEHHLV